MEYQIKAMDMWFRTLPGALVVEMEFKELDRLLPSIPGEVAVQIGGPSNLRLLQKSKMRHVYYCSDQRAGLGDGTCLQCDYHALPFESNSINLIILSHAIEFAKQPQQLLEEIYRVLRPGGQLLLFGFNRWSGWSLVRRLRHYKGYPWHGRFHSMWQVKKWLHTLGYGIVANKSFCFIPPCTKRPSATWIKLNEVLGQVFIPKMGAVHLIYAQKKVAGTTPLATLWTAKPKRLPKVVITSTH